MGDILQRCNQNAYVTSVNTVLVFLHKLYERGLSYSTLNTARSALSSFVTIENTTATVGSHTLVSRFLKGVFNLKLPVSR